MRKAITLTLSVALLGIFAAVVVAAVPPSDGRTSTGPAATTMETEGMTTAEALPPRHPGVDISGPCDEAEHAKDPRCAGVQAPGAPAEVPDRPAGVDISGPCDEAEHIGDPRCTGAGAGGAGRVDNSRPGSVNSGRNHGFDDGRHGGDLDDDRHSGPGRGGSGSGSGGSGGLDDSSGSGSGGGDGFDDDSSGSGGGGNSGSGGGD